MWVWYARPDCRHSQSNLIAFSDFGELLIGEGFCSSVPKYRCLAASPSNRRLLCARLFRQHSAPLSI